MGEEEKNHLCSYLLHRRDWKGPLCPSCWVHGAKPREGGHGTAMWQLRGKQEPSWAQAARTTMSTQGNLPIPAGNHSQEPQAKRS